ncbi:MAG: ATP-binding protein [Aquisalimonadaceae bacterium]
MKSEAAEAPDSRVRKVTFPWLSALGGLLAITYLLFTTEPGLARYYEIPAGWFQWQVKYAVLGLFILLLLLDLRRYRRQHARQHADLQRLRHQVNSLWESKKQLQLKAHTYSGHADKLKLFISDKLLDYIEYDEKFLHFKSIAAEVRHNGVISFDKVQTALQRALAAADAPADAPSSSPDYQAALDAMRYLWDLLDLSTADNLALHIGNLLCECEEHYYQRMLNIEEAAPLPYEPVYPPQRAAWRALGLVRHEPLQLPVNETEYTLDDGQWHVSLAPVGELLGNENHLVLLLENLLKNAQFFSSKRGYRAPFASIALTLREQQGQACIRVYNRGPHIRDEDRPSLFQLGFSTRRIRDHHGRGLGLYFVNEIVKGYEGRIAVHNIQTPETRYAVRMELDNEEIITEMIDVVHNDGQPQCRIANGEPVAVREWTLGAPLRNVEVSSTDGQDTQRLKGFATRGKQSHFDPGHPERPQWQIVYQPRRNANRLSFTPLDISGVEFEIHLPTAQQRLDGSELEQDADIDAEVERLDERFRAQGTYDADV